MEASKKPLKVDLSNLPPKVAKAIAERTDLLGMPLKELPKDLRAEMLGHLAGPLEKAEEIIKSAPIGKLLSGIRHEDDEIKLMGYFKGAREIQLKGPEGVVEPVGYPSQEYLIDVERKMADIMAGPPQHHYINLELYQRLTDNRFVQKIVGKAVAQLIAQGFIENPFEAGAIRYSRITRDLDRPAEEDKGCILTFHPPVDAQGNIVHGLSPKERIGMKRLAVSFFFDENGDMTKAVRQETPKDAHKINAPYNARLHIVPARTGEEEFGYSYRSIRLAEDPRFAGMKPASKEILEEAKRIQAEGRMIGIVSSDRNNEEYLVLEMHNGTGTPHRKAIKKSQTRVSQMIYDVNEEDCVQVSMGPVRFGVHILAKDMGLPQQENLGDLISRISVDSYMWSGTSKEKSYSERKRSVEVTIKEIVNAVPDLKLEPDEERKADTRRFVLNNSSVIARIATLRDEMELMREKDPEEFGRLFHTRVNKQVLTFDAAQFFQAAAQMIAHRDVLNLTYPLKDIRTFVEEWNNTMSDGDRASVMMRRDIAKPLLVRLQLLERVMRAEHSGLKDSIHEEGEKTRVSIRETGDFLAGKVESISQNQRDHVVDGLKDISEAFKLMSAENRDMLKALGVEDKELHEQLMKALNKPKETEVVIEAGVNVGLFAVKLKRSVNLGEMVKAGAEPYVMGTVMIAQDAKEKLMSGFKKLGGAFKAIREKLKAEGELEKYDEVTLAQLSSIYSNMSNHSSYGTSGINPHFTDLFGQQQM